MTNPEMIQMIQEEQLNITQSCRQMSQRRRLFSYKKKYSDLPREEYLYLLHLRRKRKKFYKDTV
ncbi:hypothetical protein ACRPK2_08730 [Lactococcus garvieae]|uniref:hypothetical protein n=1 Tax=Lactococcus garvieae TaxID=1363 RepID=UPI003D779977